MEIQKFLKTLKECVVAYRKLRSESDTDQTIAHYYPKNLSKFLKDNKESIIILSTFNFERDFIKFWTHFISEKKD